MHQSFALHFNLSPFSFYFLVLFRSYQCTYSSIGVIPLSLFIYNYFNLFIVICLPIYLSLFLCIYFKVFISTLVHFLLLYLYVSFFFLYISYFIFSNISFFVSVCLSVYMHIPMRRYLFCKTYFCWKWTWQPKFKTWMRLFAFHIELILFGNVCIQLISFKLWVNSRVDCAL